MLWRLPMKYDKTIPDNVIVSNQYIYELFKQTNIVMSIETGVLIKARKLGIPVIVTKYPHKKTGS